MGVEERRWETRQTELIPVAFQIIVLRGVPNMITLYITKVAWAMLYMQHGDMDIGNRLAVG